MKGRLAVLTKINEGAMPVLALPLIIRGPQLLRDRLQIRTHAASPCFAE